MDLVSVIVPFYRGKDWLIEALDTIEKQTYREVEIILVDDGSGVYLDDLSKKYRNLNILHKDNGGPSSARNLGINVASGKYIAFLDSDDLWIENKLEEQIQFMKRNKFRWSSTSYTKFKDGQENDAIKDNKPRFKEKSNMSLWQMISSTKIATPTVIVEKSLFDENKDLRFSENLRFGEDTCLWISLLMKSKFGYLDKHLARVRMHGSNAALNSRIQVNARSDIYDFIEAYNPKIIKEMPLILKTGYFLTRKEKKLMQNLENSNNPFMDKLVTVIYIVPWMMFKISSVIYGGSL